MDERILEQAKSVAGELEEAVRPIGLTVRRLDASETGNIPTVLIKREGKDDSPGIICNVMPTQMNGVDILFIQLYMTLTASATEDRRDELDRFVKGANERFMLGSLLTFEGSLCMRYTLALDPAEALGPAHIQTAFTAFYQQAAVFSKIGGGIVSGAMTAEAALAHRE